MLVQDDSNEQKHPSQSIATSLQYQGSFLSDLSILDPGSFSMQVKTN